MNWTTVDHTEWRRRFAIFPRRVGEHRWLWLGRYEERLVLKNYNGWECWERERRTADGSSVFLDPTWAEVD